MALIFFDGCQDAALVPKPEYGTNFFNGAVTGRDGSTNGGANAQTNTNQVLAINPGSATLINGLAMKFSSSSLYHAFCSDIAGTIQTLVMLNASGFLEVRRTSTGGTLLGTSSGHAPILTNTWTHLTTKIVLNAASAGSVALQVNGVTVLTLTGITTSSVTTNVLGIRFGSNGGASMQYDDIYVCDGVDATATQGRANNDFLGDLRIQTLFPNAPGDTTAWTPNSAVANWTTVDETPPNTTDYNSSSTSTQRDLYAVTDLVGTVGTVYGVHAAYYATKNDAGGSGMKPIIKENSVVTVEAAQALAFGSWTSMYGAYRYVRPSDSAVWTTADINALQVGQDLT